MRYRLLAYDGQSIVETILILPFFLLFVFGLLQMGQIGVALVTASYAAGSIARHVVEEDATNETDGQTRLANLMYASMRPAAVQETLHNDGPLRDVQVNACIGINPLPFVGPFVNAAIGSKYSGGGNADSCTNSAYGPVPVYFVPSGPGGKYYFVVMGSAQARMNYHL